MSDSEQEPSEIKPETENGNVRWWRPDVLYRYIRTEEDVGRVWSILFALFCIPVGWLLNNSMELAEEHEVEGQRQLAKERKLVKSRERWRMEAREEYRRENR